MFDLLHDEFTFAYLGLAFFFVLLGGVWIGWMMQSHRAQQAMQAKYHAEMIAARAGNDARSKDERLTAIERTQGDILRGVRELNKALCLDLAPSHNRPLAQAPRFEIVD